MADESKMPPELYAPGMWKCHTCGFVQQNNVICPNGIFARNEVHMDPCPNEGDVMFPVTWKEMAEENQAFGIKLLDERTETLKTLLQIERLGGSGGKLARLAIDRIFPGQNYTGE